MAEPRSSMIEPPIEDLLDKVDSKFTLVTLAARRGRQVNSYFSQLGEGLGAIVPPQVASVARKPLSIALEEIAAGKVRANFEVVQAAAAAAEAAEAAEAAASQSEDAALLAAFEAVGAGDDASGGDKAS
jgi:DNA-directed RNA polymerase subunit omega